MFHSTGVLAAGFAAMAAFAAFPLAASVSLPPLPLPEEVFASQAACVARLESLHAQDLAARHESAPVDSPEGATRRQILRSAGVERIDAETSRYQAHIGRELRIPLPEIGQIRTIYSYEERDLTCAAGRLSGSLRQGQMNDGFAPLEEGRP